MKKSVKVTERKAIPIGTVAIYSEYDGRYSSTSEPVRVVAHNSKHRQYLVEDKDGEWQVVDAADLSAFG